MSCLWKTFWQNWWWPVILLIALYLAMMFWPGDQWRSIENDVHIAVTNDLQAQNFNQLTVHTQDRGRDVLLKGSVSSEEEMLAALKLAQASSDTGNRIAPRVVEWAASIKEPEQVITLTNGRLKVDINTSDIVLTGILTNQEQMDLIVDSAKEFYAPRKIINKLSIGEHIKPFAKPSTLFSGFTIKQGAIEISNNLAILLGTVDSQQQKHAIATNVVAALGSGYVIDNRISVSQATAIPSITLSKEKQVCQDQLVKLLATSKIFFQTSKADTKSESIPLLNKISDILQQCPDAVIAVSGHTDSVGGEKLNFNLSQYRADAVASYLIQLGTAKENIKAIGFGESKPIASNTSKQGRAQNRRIEFTIK